jgi:phospholipid transport system substrate-binding protein
MTHHALATFMLLVASVAPVAAADNPTQAIKAQIDRAMQVLNDPALKGPSHAGDRRARVRKIADEIFDFAEMGKRAMGPHWSKLQAADRERYVSLFADLLDRAYFEKIDQYEGEKVRYLEPRVEGEQATVPTRVVTPRGTDIPVDYRMYRSEGRWQVYDVIIEGVSLVSNYRSQFDRIVRTDSVDELLKRMEAQVAANAGQASPRAEPKPRGAGRN